MSDIIEINVDKVCRTCLTPSTNMKSLYDTSTKNCETLADKLMSNTSLTCKSNDGFPTRMCTTCIADLNQTCAFKSKCEKSQATLQNYAHLTKTNKPPLAHNLKKMDDENARKPIEHVYIKSEHLDAELHHEIDLNIKLEQEDSPKPQQTKKLFPCPKCPSSFKRKNDLNVHAFTHTGEKPYTCAHCDRSFCNKTKLTAHTRTHTGEKPYACHQCNRSFTHQSYYKKHLRIHTGEKPFVCSVCKKSFSFTHHLTNHMRTHTGVKPFTCTECECSFSRASGLKYHLMRHTGVRPFECEVCGRKFYHQHTLTEHLRRHTGEKPFTCVVCGKAFSNKTNVTAHMRVHAKQTSVV